MKKRFQTINHYGVPKAIYDNKTDKVLKVEDATNLLNKFSEQLKRRVR